MAEQNPYDFYRVSGANNLKNLSEFNSMHYMGLMTDAQRTRQQMADAAISAQSQWTTSAQALTARGVRAVVEPDMNEAMALAEMSTRVSPTSQAYHQSSGINQLGYSHDLQSALISVSAKLDALLNK